MPFLMRAFLINPHYVQSACPHNAREAMGTNCMSNYRITIQMTMLPAATTCAGGAAPQG